jgi:hypothetical protein
MGSLVKTYRAPSIEMIVGGRCVGVFRSTESASKFALKNLAPNLSFYLRRGNPPSIARALHGNSSRHYEKPQPFEL